MSDTNNPLISVIVPVYKVEKYLDRCIRSIAIQSYRQLEIILVDDGSPDNCGRICDRWASADFRIRVIHKKNGGLSDARNTGIEQSHGEYLCFIDSDDYIEPEMIELLWHAIEKNGVSISICNYVYEYEKMTDNTRKKRQEAYQIAAEEIVSCQRLLKIMSDGKYTFGEVAWNKLYKKKLFDQIRYPVGKIHEDEFVFHRLIYQSGKMACIPYVGYHYLQHSGSIMAGPENYQHAVEALIDRCHFFIEKNEKELAAESEKRLLSIAKSAVQSGKLGKRQKKEYMTLVFQLFHKRWLTWLTLLKRSVRFYLLQLWKRGI